MRHGQPSRCAATVGRSATCSRTSTASEDYNRACLDGTVATFLGALGARGVTDLATARTKLGIRDLDDVATPELLATWRTRVAANVAKLPRARRWRCRQLGRRVSRLAGRRSTSRSSSRPTPTTSACRSPTPRRPARTQWLAQFGRFALKETKPDAETEAHDGRTRVRGEDLDIDLPDAEFVRAAAGRAAGDPSARRRRPAPTWRSPDGRPHAVPRHRRDRPGRLARSRSRSRPSDNEVVAVARFRDPAKRAELEARRRHLRRGRPRQGRRSTRCRPTSTTSATSRS